MNLEEFEAQLDDPVPLYTIDAKDDYLRRTARALSEARVPEESRVFNWQVFDLAEQPVGELISAARTLPWMAGRRWIWVCRAEEGGDDLLEYLKAPSDRTTMLLEVERKVRGWPKLPAVAAGRGGDDALKVFVSDWCRQHDCRIERKAQQLLLHRCGRNRQLLTSELQKLRLTAGSEGITVAAVETLVASEQGPDIFELIQAIAAGKKERALRLLHDLYAAGAHPQQILPLLHWNLRRLLVAQEQLAAGRRFADIVRELKIWSYKGRERTIRRLPRRFLVGALRELRKTDRMNKSTQLDVRIQLDMLVFRLVRGIQ